jgi:hypothetical protein
MDRPTGLPMVLILESRSHLDLGDLPNLLAAELGVMTVRLERAIRSLDGVARVHVNRWGDGAAHLHLWFLARPVGRLQLRGSFLSLWDDILPPIAESQWRENLALVAAWLAEFGGRALAEPTRIDWQAPGTLIGQELLADEASSAKAVAELRENTTAERAGQSASADSATQDSTVSIQTAGSGSEATAETGAQPAMPSSDPQQEPSDAAATGLAVNAAVALSQLAGRPDGAAVPKAAVVMSTVGATPQNEAPATPVPPPGRANLPSSASGGAESSSATAGGPQLRSAALKGVDRRSGPAPKQMTPNGRIDVATAGGESVELSDTDARPSGTVNAGDAETVGSRENQAREGNAAARADGVSDGGVVAPLALRTNGENATGGPFVSVSSGAEGTALLDDESGTEATDELPSPSTATTKASPMRAQSSTEATQPITPPIGAVPSTGPVRQQAPL